MKTPTLYNLTIGIHMNVFTEEEVIKESKRLTALLELSFVYFQVGTDVDGNRWYSCCAERRLERLHACKLRLTF